MERRRLLVGFRLYLKSRAVLPILFAAALIELTVPFWGRESLVAHHDSFFAAVPVSVLAQGPVAMLLLFTTGSDFENLERLSARYMRAPRAIVLVLGISVVAFCAFLACTTMGQLGTLSKFAPLTTLIGVYGVGLVAARLIDRRMAGLLGLVPVLLPFALDPSLMPFGEVISFAEPNDSTANPAPWFAIWFLAGAGLHIGDMKLNIRRTTSSSSAHQLAGPLPVMKRT